jgi:hypothetical protein
MTKNHLLHLLIEVARRQLTPQEQTELRDALAPDARIGTPRTCDNCASSASTNPRCGQCTGATATTTRWEPKNSPTA